MRQFETGVQTCRARLRPLDHRRAVAVDRRARRRPDDGSDRDDEGAVAGSTCGCFRDIVTYHAGAVLTRPRGLSSHPKVFRQMITRPDQDGSYAIDEMPMASKRENMGHPENTMKEDGKRWTAKAVLGWVVLGMGWTLAAVSPSEHGSLCSPAEMWCGPPPIVTGDEPAPERAPQPNFARAIAGASVSSLSIGSVWFRTS